MSAINENEKITYGGNNHERLTTYTANSNNNNDLYIKTEQIDSQKYGSCRHRRRRRFFGFVVPVSIGVWGEQFFL